MSYVKPQKVIAPQSEIKSVAIYHEGDAGTYAYALITPHKGNPWKACRWNGRNKDEPKGYPTSHGEPTWMALDDLEDMIKVLERIKDGSLSPE